jgi:hypothetical protein
VDLFNRVFEELGLKYRFAWFCPANDTPRERERVMNSGVAPVRAWWDQNWYHIALESVGHRPHLQEIFLRDHEKHWEVITALWGFYRPNRLWIYQNEDFEARVERIFEQVHDQIVRGGIVQIDNLHLKLRKLTAERQIDSAQFKPTYDVRGSAWRYLSGILGGEVRYWVSGKNYPPPRVKPFQGLDYPASADEYWWPLAEATGRMIKDIIIG